MSPNEVKSLAKKLRKEDPKYSSFSHCQILNEIVRALGFNSWNHYCASWKE